MSHQPISQFIQNCDSGEAKSLRDILSAHCDRLGVKAKGQLDFAENDGGDTCTHLIAIKQWAEKIVDPKSIKDAKTDGKDGVAKLHAEVANSKNKRQKAASEADIAFLQKAVGTLIQRFGGVNPPEPVKEEAPKPSPLIAAEAVAEKEQKPSK